VADLRLADMACPLDARYYGASPAFFARLRPYVSEDAFIRCQLQVELALAEILTEYGVAPAHFADEVARASTSIEVRHVYEEEERIGHVVRALVNCICERIDEPLRPFVHLFATSNDITDTATALRLKELTRDVLLPDLAVLQEALIRLARLHAHTVQIGRTHGKYAEPITFGYFLANYVARIGNRIEAIETARQNLRGKFSGAVGAYNALRLKFRDAPAIEAALLRKLGLRPVDAHVSTQVVHPEYVTDLVHSLVSTFSVMANLADDIRHLHRSEIDETQEIYDEARVGSSTMPHKLNPKNFEFVKSMWKEFMPRMMTVYMDQITEHQRDLTNSASSRFITEFMTAFAYSVTRLISAVKNLGVQERSMRRNFDEASGETLAEPLYILLSLQGHPDGHGYARRLMRKARETGSPLIDLINAEESLRPYLDRLTPDQRRALEHAENYTGLSGERTEVVCDQFETACRQLLDRLDAERRETERPRQKLLS